MVDGVYGGMDNVVRIVVVEENNVLECVTILLLPVEEIAQGQVVVWFRATPTAVMVRFDKINFMKIYDFVC